MEHQKHELDHNNKIIKIKNNKHLKKNKMIESLK